MDTNTQAAITTGETIVAALAPLAGPDGIIANQVLDGLVGIVESYQALPAGEPYTIDMLLTAIAKTDDDIAAFAADLGKT